MTLINKAQTEMSKALSHLKSLFKGVAAGKADPDLLNTVRVDCYGSKTPISQLSLISILDYQTLKIEPYDTTLTTNIAKALNLSSLNFRVERTKHIVTLKLPQISGDARKKLVKHVESLAEQQRIALRKIRQNIKKELKGSDLSKDEKKGVEKKLDVVAKDFSKQLDVLLDEKRKILLRK